MKNLLTKIRITAINPQQKQGDKINFGVKIGKPQTRGVSESQSQKINKYLSNAYKVFSGQKSEQVVANLVEDVAKKTKLPKDIVVKKTFFDHIAECHPELNRQQLFDFVKTLNIPDEIYQLSKEQRLNFFRNLENKTINLVSTGKDWIKPQQNVITSFIPQDAKELKYVEGIKNTSKKVFPINSGGAVISSSDMLSQVPSAGDRISGSSKSTNSITPDVKDL